MKHKISTFFLIILSILFILQCSGKNKDENTGEWKYRIFINGNNAGSAILKISSNSDHYIHELDMETTTGNIRNTSRKLIVETKNFKPVSIEIINKIINNNIIQEIQTIAYAKENGVDVISDNKKYFVKIETPFMFDGLHNIAELKKIKFKTGELIKSRIFDPQVESESSVILNTAAAEKMKFIYRGKEIEIFHVLQYINNLKTIEMFMDSKGNIYKSKTTMLNYTMEMILE